MKDIVADAGPMIALGKVNQLGLLHALFERVFLTSFVFDEIHQGQDQATVAIKAAIQQKWVKIEKAPAVPEALSLALDAGEASAILLASATRRPLLMDERLGRKIASEKGLCVIGTVGVLLLAKKRKQLPLVKPVLIEMRTKGYWLSDTLIQEALYLARE